MKIVAVLKAMFAAGATAEVLMAAIEAFQQEDVARKAEVSARKRKSRAQDATTPVTSVTLTDDVVTLCDIPPSLPKKEKSPLILPSKERTPTLPPLSSLRSESINDDWPKDFSDQFWTAYPRKVGKMAAIRKLELVRKNTPVPWNSMISSVRAIKADDPQFIPHPTTWLTQGRFLDGVSSNTGPPIDQQPDWKKPPWEREGITQAAWRERENAKINGTQVRRDAGVGKNGADRPSELPLSGGSSLRDHVVQARGRTPDDFP